MPTKQAKYKGIAWMILFFFMISGVSAQHYFTHSEENKQISVVSDTKEPLLYPWAGGLNSCQFGEIDLNLDGIKDLFVFDRVGNKILTFLNAGQQNVSDYDYAPEYGQLFPELFSWVILRDYNNDGLEDIFTYARDFPGIIVYKNTSDNELEFTLEVFPFLTSLQGGGQVNILTTDVDYPGIADIDNDGDMDILTFWGLGSFVEYHQNQSMEVYGIPDSLEYVEVTQCWGFFAESDESNTLYLDTCMGSSEPPLFSAAKPFVQTGTRHTGSTFLLIDLDADQDKDLILGDVDYPNPIQLMNGGNTDSAHMISHDPQFPSYDKPFNLFSMPASAYIDINNDGLKDLVSSPFDPSLFTSANHRSVWLYQNSGTNDAPVFNFVQNNFLQENMIDVGSGAYPVLADWNGDGLKDLFISNYGYYMYSFYQPGQILNSVYWSNIALYENTGTTDNPQFTHVTHDFEGLHSLHLTGMYPSFGDLDGDGDEDMVFGRANGSLVFLENMAGQGNEMAFGEPEMDYKGIHVGAFSTPVLFDLDKDGLLDLLIGEKAGNLNYYKNTGSQTNPQFLLETDSLGKINVTVPNVSLNGYSTPRLFYTAEENMEMIVGSEQGKLFYYKDFEDNLSGEFIENDSLYLLVDNEPFEFENGIRNATAIADLTNDGFFELMVGNFSGGLSYYSGTGQPGVSGIYASRPMLNSLHVFPNPATDQLNIQSEVDLSNWQGVLTRANGLPCMEFILDGKYENSINVSQLPPGLYLLSVFPNKPVQGGYSTQVILAY